MPPKQAPNKKTVEKVKAKIVEDKTFGLKNKKGAKQQKFIQQVEKQVANKGVQNRNAPDANLERAKKKEEEQKKKEELLNLFKPVAQTVPKGVDPKSVVCAYFKQGICQKGDKCKFSHDLSVERKAEKRNIYADTRENGMENWDDEKLEDVVNQKHGDDNKKKNQTQIVCKYFIEAVENKTYGWFWNCPNGDTCMYRHALPPGFTLKSEMKKKSEDDEISIEMLIEKERASLGAKTTKVTLESFLAWKARKLVEKRDEIKKKEEKKLKDFKLGFMNGLTGRDLFTFNPDMVQDDDDAGDIDYKIREDDYDDENGQMIARELNAEYFASQAMEADDTGTVATSDRFAYMESLLENEEKDKQIRKEHAASAACGLDVENLDNGEQNDEEDNEEAEEGEQEEEGEEDNNNDEKTEQSNFKSSLINNDTVQSKNLSKQSNNNATNKTNGAKIEIDESLFNLDDLADIQDELENLDI